MSAELMVQAARSLVGVKWRHRGRTHSGIDCLGLLDFSASVAGLIFQEIPKRYGREPWEDSLRQGLRLRFGEPLDAALAAPGDIALIRWGKGEPSHVGIVATHPDFGLSLVHAHTLHGVVEQGLSGHIRDAVIEVYRPVWGS